MSFIDVSGIEVARQALQETEQSGAWRIRLARAMQRAWIEEGRTQVEIGRVVGMDQSTVSNHIRILEAPADVLRQLHNDELTYEQVRDRVLAKDPPDLPHLTHATRTLKKYMEHVREITGSDHVLSEGARARSGADFGNREWAGLRRIASTL